MRQRDLSEHNKGEDPGPEEKEESTIKFLASIIFLYLPLGVFSTLIFYKLLQIYASFWGLELFQ